MQTVRTEVTILVQKTETGLGIEGEKRCLIICGAFHLWNTRHNVLSMGPQGSHAVDAQIYPLVKRDVSAVTVINSVVFRLVPAILRIHRPCNLG